MMPKPMEIVFPPDWQMPRPPAPVGAFTLWDDSLWMSSQDWSTVIAPGVNLRILAGFLSDGATIPRLLQSAFTPRFEGTTFGPAYGHDGLYAARLVPRATADLIFFRQLLASGVHPAKARGYYFAVRMCGWWTWSRHTPESVAQARLYVSLQLPEAA